MPRPRKSARLWLRKRAGREGVYVIIDGAHEEGTGLGERSLAQAEIKLADYIAGKSANARSANSPAALPVSELLAFYGENHAPKTAAPELVGYHIDALIGYWGEKAVTDIMLSNCEAYVAWRTAQPYKHAKTSTARISVNTAKRELGTLQAAVNYWHARFPLAALPVVALPDGEKTEARWLTRTEAAHLLYAARRLKLPHLSRFIIMGLYTGSRHATILALRWLPSTDSGWIDLERRIIYRRGREERQTKKRRPAAKLARRLVPHLVRWQATDSKGYTSTRIREARPISHVITWRGKPLGEIDTSFRRAVVEAGLDEEVTPHTLRHTFVTWALQGGADFWEVAGSAGMSRKMVEDIYGHHHPDFQESVSEAMDGPRRRS